LSKIGRASICNADRPLAVKKNPVHTVGGQIRTFDAKTRCISVDLLQQSSSHAKVDMAGAAATPLYWLDHLFAGPNRFPAESDEHFDLLRAD
jgi:hypothetical protein